MAHRYRPTPAHSLLALGSPRRRAGRLLLRALPHLDADRLVEKLFKKDIEDYQYVFEDKDSFKHAALTSLCEAAIKRRPPPPVPPVKEASDRLLWLGPKLSVAATRLLRQARSSLITDRARGT